MQDQAMPWPSWVCAMVQSVSPCRTVYFVTASEGAREAGTTICEPTSRSSGLRRPGFSVRSSCQRCPSPRHRSEEHTSELQSQSNLVCRLLLEKKNNQT